MTFETLFQEIKNYLLQLDVSGVKQHFAAECQVKGNAGGVFYVEIKEGNMQVEPYNYYDKDVLITASDSVCAEICKGELNPKNAYAVGLLQVDGNINKFFEKCC